MILVEFIIASVFLVVIGYLDLKSETLSIELIPSFLTTGFIILELVYMGFGGVLSGLVAGLMALSAYELQSARLGLADIKVIIAMGIAIGSVYGFFLYYLITVIVGVLYSLTLMKFVKKFNKNAGIPYIPVYLISMLLYLWAVIL